MDTRSLAILCLSFLLLAACGGSSTAQPSTNMQTVTTMSAKVAAHYGETDPKIRKVLATLTDGSTAVPMNIVALDGHFHKGNLVATHLSFSMLADGGKVWAIYATDDQYPTTRTDVWFDPGSDSDITL
jgi:hypothetical protein